MWASEYPTSSLGNTFLHNILKILCLEQMFIIRAHIRNEDLRLAWPDLCTPCTRGCRQGPGKPCHALSSDFDMESWLNTITLNFNRWKISQGKWVWEMLNPVLSLVFIIHISSVGYLLENPASIKLFNFDGFVHCLWSSYTFSQWTLKAQLRTLRYRKTESFSKISGCKWQSDLGYNSSDHPLSRRPYWSHSCGSYSTRRTT